MNASAGYIVFTVSTVPAFIGVQYFFIDLLASVMVPLLAAPYHPAAFEPVRHIEPFCFAWTTNRSS